MASSSPSTMCQANNGATASPPRVFKRKAVTEADILKPAKRSKCTANKPAFAQEWQQDLQKARGQVVIRPDELEGVIIPPKFLPKPIHSKWGGITTFDDERTRRWASLNKDKARVKKNRHVDEDVRDRALASFPKMEARKKEEQQDRLRAKDVMLEEVTVRIDRLRQQIVGAKRAPSDDMIDLPKVEFLHQCWKNLNYATRFQVGPLEHQEIRKYGVAFARTWATRKSKLWRPQWKKDKKRACLVMEWVYHRA